MKVQFERLIWRPPNIAEPEMRRSVRRPGRSRLRRAKHRQACRSGVDRQVFRLWRRQHADDARRGAWPP